MRIWKYVYAVVAGWVVYSRVYRRLSEFVRGYVGMRSLHSLVCIRSHRPEVVTYYIVFMYKAKLAGGMAEECYERPVIHIGDMSQGDLDMLRRRIGEMYGEILVGACWTTVGVDIELTGVKVLPNVDHLLRDRSIRLGNRYIDLWELIHRTPTCRLVVLEVPRRRVEQAIWGSSAS